MNKFTLKELEDLEEFLSDAPEFFDDEDESLFNLHKKVKSMINKYCEHDTHETSALIKYCYKCNHSEFVSL